jgi:DinB family protein
MSELADLLERFRRGGELLAVATTGAAGPELDFKPAPEKWCVRQIVCHLADSEAVNVMRLRQILAEEHPTLQSFNGEAWAERLDYGRRKLSPVIETFRRLRTENHELLKDLSEEAFARSGTHTEAGPLTLRALVKGSAEHVEEHVKQIQGVRAAYKEHKAKHAAG